MSTITRPARTLLTVLALCLATFAGAAPVRAEHLPDRVPVPGDANGDGVPDAAASALSTNVCDRVTLRDALRTASDAAGGALGRCEESGGAWTWFPPASRTLAELVIPDPHQDPETAAVAIDRDGDGVPGEHAVVVKTLRVRIDSTGDITYEAGPDVGVPAGAGPDPNDDADDPCAATTPVPRVTPVLDLAPDPASGTVGFTAGASVVLDCEELAPPPATGTLGPAFPQTLRGVPTGDVAPIDADEDGVPSRFELATEDLTFEAAGEAPARAPGAPLVLSGPDPDETSECGATTPVPAVDGPFREIALQPDGSITFHVGAVVTIGCDVHDLTHAGETAPSLPQTLPATPSGPPEPVDEDADGLPGAFIVRMERVTIVAIGQDVEREPVESLVLPGLDPDGCDCNPSPTDWLFTRNTDGDADTDFNELVGFDPIANPGGATAFMDEERTLSDPDGDEFDTNEERSAGTNPDDPLSHPNRAPTITLEYSLADGAVDENAAIVIIARATDRDMRFQDPDDPRERLEGPRADVPDVTCDITELVGAELTDGPGEARITWTPDYTQGRDDPYAFQCTAEDHGMPVEGAAGEPIAVSEDGAVLVANVDDAPVFLAMDAEVSLDETQDVAVPFVVTDTGPAPKEYEDLVITLLDAPAWATLNEERTAILLDPSHATIAHPEIELQRTLTLRVDDGVTPPVDRSIDVTILDVNQAPTLAFAPGMPEGGFSASEGVAMDPIRIVVTDADGDAVTVTPPAEMHGAAFDAPTLTFTWTPDHTRAALSPYSFTFTANDGFGATPTIDLDVNVQNVNQLPTIAIPGAPFLSVGETEVASLVVTSSDPDEGSAAPTLSVLETSDYDDAWMSFDPLTGTFAVTPDFDVVGPYPATSATFTVTFQAEDEEGEKRSIDHTFTVVNLNRPPVVEPSAPLDASVLETGTYTGSFDVSDPDGDAVEFVLLEMPAGTVVDAAARSFSWQPGQDFVPHSDEDLVVEAAFRVRVRDGHGDAATYPPAAAHVVQVHDVNRPPVLAAVADQTVAEGGTLTFTISATDADGDALTYSHTGGAGSFDPLTRTLTFSPTHGEVVHPAMTALRTSDFRVDDGVFAGDDELSVAILVTDENRPPVATLGGTFPADMIVGHVSGAFSARLAPSCAGSADPDPEDVVECTFDWGDGSELAEGDPSSAPTHDYTTPGPVTFTLTVRDTAEGVAVGGSDARTRSFKVYLPGGDNDGDGLTNAEELTGSRNNLYGNARTDPDDFDTDNDVDRDGDEIVGGSDPNNKRSTRADRDGDGIPNGQESALFGRTGRFSPDERDDPIDGGLPVHNGELLLRPDATDAQTRARLEVWYDQDADRVRDAEDPTVLDTDLLYTLDPELDRVTLRTSAAGLEDVVIERQPDGSLRVVGPDEEERVVPAPLTLVEILPCGDDGAAVTVVPALEGSAEVCTAGVVVAGMTIVPRQTRLVHTFPRTLPVTVPAGPPQVTGPDLDTGAPAHVRIEMRSVVVNAPPQAPTFGPAVPIDMDVGPSVRVVECEAAFTPAAGDTLGTFCVGADVFVDGEQVASREERFVEGPFPRTLPPVPAGPPEITHPDFDAGTPARVRIPMQSVVLHEPPTPPSFTESVPIDMDVGVGVRVVGCEAAFTPAPDRDDGKLGTLCVGADVFVAGDPLPIATKVEMDVPSAFPVRVPVPVVDLDAEQPVRVTSPDLDEGTPARVRVEMEDVWIEEDGSRTQSETTDIDMPVGPAVLVVPCSGDAVTPRPGDGGVDVCLGANVFVDGQQVARRVVKSVVGPFPVRIPVPVVDLDASPPVVVTPPDREEGTAARVLVEREDVTVHADGSLTETEAEDLDMAVGPAVRLVLCEDAPVSETEDGRLHVCVGADVFVDGQQVAERFEEDVDTPLPFTVPVPVVDLDAEEPVHVSPADTSTGTPARVRVERATLTLTEDGVESEEAEDLEEDVGVGVRIEPCPGEPVRRDEDTGVLHVCLGANVYVGGSPEPVAERVELEVPPGGSHELPADTPAIGEPDVVRVTAPDLATGTPARVVVKMERVTVHPDGTTTPQPAPDREARGPVLRAVLLDADDAPTTDPTAARAVVVSAFLDGNDDGIKQDEEPGFADARADVPEAPDALELVDEDNDLIPDGIEFVFCAFESGSDPGDGSCDGMRDYTPPPGVPARP